MHLPSTFKADHPGCFNVPTSELYNQPFTPLQTPTTTITSISHLRRLINNLTISHLYLHIFVAMVFREFDFLIEGKISQNGDNSTSPLCGFVDLPLYCTFFYKMQSFFLSFWFFLTCQHYSNASNVREGEQLSKPEISHQENKSKGSNSIDNESYLERDEVKMVMAKLGFFCSSEGEELSEKYGSKELSGLFEEHEPSLEEVKQAFDVFDENKDGFIDAKELQRVLRVLGLKEAGELENCHKMIRVFDTNQDGRIDFIEFVKIMENRLC